MLKVFVYGTLKPGEYNYLRFCTGSIVSFQPAITRGKLYSLRVGYPGMVEENGLVQGFLLCFKDDAVLEDLDKLEEYNPNRPADQNEYERKQVEIFTSPTSPPPTTATFDEVIAGCQSLGKVWTYFMTKEKVKELGGVLIESGCWVADDTPYVGR
ncbi:MAG TPA: gamma-glutamylcyclotransferase [Halomicronema sp.]